MDFLADKIQVKELADGSIRVYIDSGEYQYQKILRELANLRDEAGSQATYDISIDVRTSGDVPVSEDSNDYQKIHTKIQALANLKDLEKEELEGKIKEAWGKDSFKDFSESELQELLKSVQSQINEEQGDELP